MDESKSDEKGIFTFFKTSIFQSNANIRSDNHLSMMSNIALILLVFIGTVLILYIAYLPISFMSSGFEQYAGWGLLVVFMGLTVYLFLMPVMLVNIFIVHYLNKKIGTIVKSFDKVLSDHTTIWISTFLLFSLGLYFYSYLETLRPYATLAGSLIIFVSIVIYIRRLISLVNYYIKDDSRIAANIYAIVLVVTVLFGLPLFLSYLFDGALIEQLRVNVWLLLEDSG